jgi:histidine ammonia-lyase
MPHFVIDDRHYTIAEIIQALDNNTQVTLSTSTQDNINANRTYLEEKINVPDALYYGINTGFGSLCNVKISNDELSQLQENLVKSHACGTGYILSSRLCQLIFLLKIINLSKAHSGVRLSLIDHMIAIYNAGIYPVIFEQGSLGASGDLAPLAHLSLTLIGEGKAYVDGKIVASIEALKSKGIMPCTLAAKEGLALLNGTQFSLAHALICIDMALRALNSTYKITSLSLEGYACSKDPYDALIGKIRNNVDQSEAAQAILDLVSDSKLMGKKYSVQDPYSFRCVPQVLGASLSAIKHVKYIVENELNAVTDNPNIFHKEDKIISAGNFHAQSLALVLDYLCLAMAEIASISERRTFQLIHGERDLPAFLINSAGLNSGFMIAQYTAASIVSQNKQLCTPSSIDTIPSSRGQEDHVSMAANGATKCIKVCDNTLNVLAIELLVAAQSLDFRDINLAASHTQALHKKVRTIITHLDTDRILHNDINAARELLDRGL